MGAAWEWGEDVIGMGIGWDWEWDRMGMGCEMGWDGMGAAGEVRQIPGHLSLSHQHSGKLLEEILVSAPQTPAHGAVAKPRAQVTPPDPSGNLSSPAGGSHSGVLGGEGAPGVTEDVPDPRYCPAPHCPQRRISGRGPGWP